MAWMRRLPIWQWILLGIALVLIVVAAFGLIFGWLPPGATLALGVFAIALNIASFRRLWKQSDHPAFHNRSTEPRD